MSVGAIKIIQTGEGLRQCVIDWYEVIVLIKLCAVFFVKVDNCYSNKIRVNLSDKFIAVRKIDSGYQFTVILVKSRISHRVLKVIVEVGRTTDNQGEKSYRKNYIKLSGHWKGCL